MSEPELVFHNSIPIEEENLPEARERASYQKDIVLDFFKWHPNNNYTPYEVFDQLSEAMMLLTSIRRSITDLTKEGRLIKGDYSESRKGRYSALNRVWRYNKEYVAPISPMTKEKLRDARCAAYGSFFDNIGNLK
jgi:hypothetical protein